MPASALSNMHPPSPPQNSTSPPSKDRELKSWWSKFKKKSKEEEEKAPVPAGIFGVPLKQSISYANVAISLTNEHGRSYIYGYVPIVIAKCGVFLKEKGTEIHGIFRLPGSSKRIKELERIFDSPDRYGKGLNWEGYTVHDAGSIFRRYINNLPEPVIPLSFYERYRDPIRNHQKEATGDPDAPPDTRPAAEFDHNATIKKYQLLIKQLPDLNRQLLLYLLDLLAVFAAKQEINGMDSYNLSAVFQPGILSHPTHDLSPQEYKLSQNVLVYLIMNQDHFLVGMSGTQTDDKTVKDMQSGAQRQPATPSKATHAGLGRSASSASAGTDSLRRANLMKRNASVSSKNSNLSGVVATGSPAPSSPLVGGASSGGVHRSNTVPSKKSPSLSSPHMSRILGAEAATPPASGASTTDGLSLTPPGLTLKAASQNVQSEPKSPLAASTIPSIPEKLPAPAPEAVPASSDNREIPSNEQLRLHTPEQGAVITTISSPTPTPTPTKDRRSLFVKHPVEENQRRDIQKPKKLQKKHRPGDPTGNTSPQSSTHSLPGVPSPTGNPPQTPVTTATAANNSIIPTLLNTEASPVAGDPPPRLGELDKVSSFHVSHHSGSNPNSPGIRPAKSPAPSTHSGLITEESEAEQVGGNGASDKSQKRRSRWRLSTSVKKDQEPLGRDAAAPLRLESAAVAETPSSMGSPESKPQKSATYDSQQTGTNTEASGPSSALLSSSESTPSKDKEHDGGDEKERKGLFGRIKAKVTQSKEDKREREAEKERAKSPFGRKTNEHDISKQSLGAIVSEGSTTGQAGEGKVEGGGEKTAEKSAENPTEQ